MKNILHATFDNAQDGIGAVESLLHHGVPAEDIHLILPQPEEPEKAAVYMPQEGESVTRQTQDAPAPALSVIPRGAAKSGVDPLLPQPPQLSKLFPHGALPHDPDPEMTAHVPGYRYDALGAVIRDSEPGNPSPPSTGSSSPIRSNSLIGSGHEARIDTEQGLGLGLAAGLLTAMCVPGVGLIDGSVAILADLLAAGAVAGGLAGGIYGYLVDRGIDHEVAQKVSEHLAGGGTTVSITLSGALKKAEIVLILKGWSGHLIQ